jgi:hypothetical protein
VDLRADAEVEVDRFEDEERGAGGVDVGGGRRPSPRHAPVRRSGDRAAPCPPHNLAERIRPGTSCRGGFTVDITWKDGRLDHARIHPSRTTTHRVRYGDTVTELTFTQQEALIVS